MPFEAKWYANLLNGILLLRRRLAMINFAKVSTVNGKIKVSGCHQLKNSWAENLTVSLKSETVGQQQQMMREFCCKMAAAAYIQSTCTVLIV